MSQWYNFFDRLPWNVRHHIVCIFLVIYNKSGRLPTVVQQHNHGVVGNFARKLTKLGTRNSTDFQFFFSRFDSHNRQHMGHFLGIQHMYITVGPIMKIAVCRLAVVYCYTCISGHTT